MKTVSVLEFRKDAEKVIRSLQAGQRFVLSYRGRAVARMEPIRREIASEDDPFYRLSDLALSGGRSLTNEEMDTLIYEK